MSMISEHDIAAVLDQLPEPIRLVVWDLDDTFWSGTLSEGGIRHCPAHEEIVVELARRGIMSSICSKNDRAAVEAAFAGRKVWDYFIFPQVSWEAKGPNVQALIEAIQLRPESILFIDDNHLARKEVAHFVPGICIADESVIPYLLDHPRLKGKDDHMLSRLAQYKLLEQRHADILKADGGTEEFLRASQIVVSIDHDVESNLDRAIELINRTNQLNFTKRRLSDNPATAREELLKLTRRYDMQSGLIRVRDRYGDYGYVGFYAEQRSVHSGSGLHHYCFSCRILGIGVETWLYRRLGRPPIAISGEVLSDIYDDTAIIDWITEIPYDGVAAGTTPRLVSEVALRGGCELLAVSHYCRQLTPDTYGDFAFNRGDIQLRLEHSIMARYVIDPPSQEALASFYQLGFSPQDFESRMLRCAADDAIWIMSFWSDPEHRLYRHKRTGALIPFYAFPAVDSWKDLTKIRSADVKPGFADHWIVPALAHCAEAYEPADTSDEALFKNNLGTIFSRMGSRQRAFIIGSNEWMKSQTDNTKMPRPRHILVNNWTKEVIAEYPHVTMLEAKSYLEGEADIDPIHPDHYARIVYHRIFKMICERL